ncbi:MAG: multicopper oxidase domain-containing protein [Gammaproteobacteria bacterium]
MKRLRHLTGFCLILSLGLPAPLLGQAYREPAPTRTVPIGEVEPFCPKPQTEWREPQVIEGVKIQGSPVCSPDNPYEVAAFVKGTNNIGMSTLMETLLSTDALIIEDDRDGDGDPDEIHLRLEVVELNGHSPDVPEPVPTYSIAPGITPGFWVFAPKTRGMSTETFLDLSANRLLRLPSPAIRVEQGDTLKVTLENSHYFPHTIHFHGVDHPFEKATGEGNDGVPEISERLILPGKNRTYEMTPRQTGTMAYHCHVQPHVHILMGLIGMIVVEENRANNWVQTLNIGAGQVRSPSVAVREKYDQEYDLQYQSIDRELHEIIQTSNDPRVLARAMHVDYNITEATTNYYMVNGRSTPYSERESLIVVKPNQTVKLRLFNASDEMVAIHPHGHKVKLTHADGVEMPAGAQIMRDVVALAPLQRYDVELDTRNDGLHSYGPGVWMMHDHFERASANDGMNPGGGMAMIVYESYLGAEGMPKMKGEDTTPLWTKEYYQRKVPVWITSGDPSIIGAWEGDERLQGPGISPLALGGFVIGILVLLGTGVLLISKRRKKARE